MLLWAENIRILNWNSSITEMSLLKFLPNAVAIKQLRSPWIC